MKYPTSFLFVAIIGINGCSHPHDQQSARSTGKENKYVPANAYRYVDDTPKPTLEDIEWSFYSFASGYVNRTDLAKTKGINTELDGSKQILGKTIRIVGEIDNIRNVGAEIVIDMKFELNGEKQISADIRSALHSLTFSRAPSLHRRSWQIQIHPNLNEYPPQTLSKWQKGTRIALDGRITSANGFQLNTASDTGIQLATEDQTLHIEPVSEIVRGDLSQYDSVTIMIDISGSMSECFPKMKRVTRQLIRALSPNQQFNVVAFSSDCNFCTLTPELVPANTQQINPVISTLDNLVPEGKTYIGPALEYAIDQNPSAIFIVSDFDFDSRVFGLLPKSGSSTPVLHFIRFNLDSTFSEKPLATHSLIKSTTFLNADLDAKPYTRGLFAAALAPYLTKDDGDNFGL